MLDSLPYIDNDIDDPAIREKLDAELAKEMKSMPRPVALPPDVELFKNNPILRAELERVQKQEPLSALDTTRYKLPNPSDPSATEADWQAALDNAKAQLEHQKTRQTNLALLQTYGANAWRIHNYLVEESAKSYEKALEEINNEVTELNRDRKNSQILAGKQLNSLETRWTELISGTLQLELANVALEGEIDELRRRDLELGNP
ncbi:hypothetical protein FRC03_010266 [Tulasnella sp. 419]|nr:hypothetical protein FRC02_000496 [Tulasnella sp. 418]KAG8957327.1 hypothetical protein FRC03_010266 [Tulasnella sp. 419]